jgi:hypothetical protein
MVSDGKMVASRWIFWGGGVPYNIEKKFNQISQKIQFPILL